MKIVFFIQGMKSGGAERVMSVLCNSMADKGHKVVLGITETMDDMAYPISEKVDVKDIIPGKGSVIARRMSSIRNMRRLIKSENPDVVISFITRTNLCVIMASRFLKVPVIISERNDPRVDPKSMSTRLARKLLYPLSKGWVFQTGYAKEYFGKRIKQKSEVIFNPVSDEVLKCNKALPRNKTIVTVCRLEPQKNVNMLIDAFDRISNDCDYNLEIYGTGSLHDLLDDKIKHMGLENRVKLMGYTSRAIEVMAQAEIFVLSSDYEGMPNSLIEAMCVGCACIATDAPAYGAREFINDGKNGILVKVGDTQGLASAMKRVIDDENLRKEFHQNAKEVYKNVASDKIVYRWLEYIDRICDK